MKTLINLFKSGVIVIFLSGLCIAQQIEIQLPEYTDDQRWDRMEFHWESLFIVSIAFAKAHNVTPEEYFRFIGKQFAPTWEGDVTPERILRGTYLNTAAWRNHHFEILDAMESMVRFRTNRFLISHLRTYGEQHGISDTAIEKFFSIVMDEITKYHGLSYEQNVEGDYLVITVKKR